MRKKLTNLGSYLSHIACFGNNVHSTPGNRSSGQFEPKQWDYFKRNIQSGRIGLNER